MVRHMSDLRVPTFTVADRLRKARTTTGLDQADFAADLGISRGTVNNYETGRTEPNRAMLAKWAMRCAVPPEWLAFGVEPNVVPRGQVERPTYWYVATRLGDRVAATRLGDKYAPVVRIGSRPAAA